MSELKSILVTTEHRGVWFAQVDPEMDLSLKESATLNHLKNCKMAIYWGTERGFHQLCKTGPTEKSTISDETNIISLPKVTGVFEVSPEAAKKWMEWNSK